MTAPCFLGSATASSAKRSWKGTTVRGGDVGGEWGRTPSVFGVHKGGGGWRGRLARHSTICGAGFGRVDPPLGGTGGARRWPRILLLGCLKREYTPSRETEWDRLAARGAGRSKTGPARPAAPDGSVGRGSPRGGNQGGAECIRGHVSFPTG